jgi:integrase
MMLYLENRAPKTNSAAWLATMARPIIAWWHGKAVSAICRDACHEYEDWRTQTVSKATVRAELSILRAAIKFYHAGTPLQGLPIVTLPELEDTREDYFWSRPEAARRLRAAWRNPRTRHVARLILIGLYSGTRLTAMLRMRWLSSTNSGWIDLEGGLLHRRGSAERKTKKSQPTCKIHKRLLPHLRRWHAQDTAKGIVNVISYKRRPVQDVAWAWRSAGRAAGATKHDTPHILRHTSATWFVQAGLKLPEISSYLGMSVPTLTKVYWHRSPEFQDNIAATVPKPAATKSKAKSAG